MHFYVRIASIKIELLTWSVRKEGSGNIFRIEMAFKVFKKFEKIPKKYYRGKEQKGMSEARYFGPIFALRRLLRAGIPVALL